MSFERRSFVRESNLVSAGALLIGAAPSRKASAQAQGAKKDEDEDRSSRGFDA